MKQTTLKLVSLKTLDCVDWEVGKNNVGCSDCILVALAGAAGAGRSTFKVVWVLGFISSHGVPPSKDLFSVECELLLKW